MACRWIKRRCCNSKRSGNARRQTDESAHRIRPPGAKSRRVRYSAFELLIALVLLSAAFAIRGRGGTLCLNLTDHEGDFSAWKSASPGSPSGDRPANYKRSASMKLKTQLVGIVIVAACMVSVRHASALMEWWGPAPEGVPGEPSAVGESTIANSPSELTSDQMEKVQQAIANAPAAPVGESANQTVYLHVWPVGAAGMPHVIYVPVRKAQRSNQ